MNGKRIGIVILAAGGSSRMGRPKQLLQLDGKSLVRGAAQTAIDAGGKPIVLVTGAAAEEVGVELRDLPVHLASNPAWQMGMGSSIQAGMARLMQIDPILDAAIIMLSDQPHVSAESLRNLLREHIETEKPLCAASFGDTVAPPALFARQFFNELLSIPAQHGAKQILLSHSSDLRRVNCPEAARDVDTPADYESLRFAPDSSSSIQK